MMRIKRPPLNPGKPVKERRFFMMGTGLFCAENTVACIAQTRTDIGIFIQAAIQMAYIDLDIWMCLVKAL